MSGNQTDNLPPAAHPTIRCLERILAPAHCNDLLNTGICSCLRKGGAGLSFAHITPAQEIAKSATEPSPATRQPVNGLTCPPKVALTHTGLGWRKQQ